MECSKLYIIVGCRRLHGATCFGHNERRKYGMSGTDLQLPPGAGEVQRCYFVPPVTCLRRLELSAETKWPVGNVKLRLLEAGVPAD